MDKITSREAIKSVANTQFTAKIAYEVGEAYASALINSSISPKKIIIGKDTRASGDMIEAALSAGFCSRGVSVVSLGTIPVPAISWLIKKYKVSGGVAISAGSENSEYNGVTLFDSSGRELAASEVESLLSDTDVSSSPIPMNDDMGRISRSHTALRDYVDYVKSTATVDLSGIKIAVDVAFGAGFECAKLVFKELGADVDMLHNIPNGKNINDNCGILHPDIISKYVTAHRCDIGISFDGACHDYLASDENGKILSSQSIAKIISERQTDFVTSNCGIIEALKLVCVLKQSGKKLSQI
ncbi:MAG: hypothetical protein II998_06705 [Clostridia bacterium]|nr:hypothetical protein [Clostridia bacterium]